MSYFRAEALNFVMMRNQPFLARFEAKDANGNPVDLTGFEGFRMRISATTFGDASSIIAEIDTGFVCPAGVIEREFTAAEIATYPLGSWAFEAQVIESGGVDFVTCFQGTVAFLQSIFT